jgi:translation initiation factor 3 subunit E
MIDYTKDIRERLSLDESMPEELMQKRQTVLDKLKELQADIKPLMDCIGEIQARETMKDSKTLVNVIQSEYNVRNIRLVGFVHSDSSNLLF